MLSSSLLQRSSRQGANQGNANPIGYCALIFSHILSAVLLVAAFTNLMNSSLKVRLESVRWCRGFHMFELSL